MKKLWILYLILIGLILGEKFIQLFNHVGLGDLVGFGINSFFFVAAYFCASNALNKLKSALGIAATLLFVFYQGFLSLQYFFGDQAKFYVFSIGLVFLFTTPVWLASIKFLVKNK